MKPIYRQGVIGPGQIIPMDYRTVPFAVGVMGIPSSNFTGTWSVQHSLDDPGPDGAFAVAYSQATTVITVTDLRSLNGVTGHGLSVGDTVDIEGVPGLTGPAAQLPVASIISQTQYTLTSPNSQTAAGNAIAHNFRWDTHVSLVNQTGRADGNYAFPVRAIRLNITAISAGYMDLILLQGWSH